MSAIFFLHFATVACAQSGPASSDTVARAALAALGVAALPGGGSSTLSVDSANGENVDFFSTRIGGGFDAGEDGKLHFEGYLVYQNYSPIYLLPTADPTFIDVRWSSLAATGGIGRNYELADGLVLRPSALATVGHVFGKAILDGLLPASFNSAQREQFENGLFVGGLGGSLSLEFERQIGEGAVDLRARQSWMRFVPLSKTKSLNASSIASSTNLFGEYSRPLGDNSGPRAVLEASYTYFWGDQSQILRTDWLGSIGAGIELPTPAGTPAGISTGRLMLRYVLGEGYDGLSLGISLAF